MSTLAVVHRAEHAALVAGLARRLDGDLAAAQDAVGEAFLRAAERWPIDGVPDRPGAWLQTVAWRRAIDARRRARPSADPEELSRLVAPEPDAEAPITEDERLGLILACCHPSLALADQVALTLRHVIGLDEQEVAASFLTDRAAIAKRLVRARRKLRDAGVSFAVPAADELPERLHAVRHVILLVFDQGYFARGDGPPIRDELCDEAVWLAGELHALAPQDTEATALLALLLLHRARRPARLDHAGELVALGDQDPTTWDAGAIDHACALIATIGHEPPQPLALQAAIATIQVLALQRGDPVPWRHVSRLYDALARQEPSLSVEINRAIARGRAAGPAAGLAILKIAASNPRADGYALFHAACADLLTRAGHLAPAAEAWQRAIERTANPAQRRRLLAQASTVDTT